MRGLGLCACIAALCLAVPVAAQRSTERFIPIGQSPGLEGKTYIGAVESLDLPASSLTLAGPDGPHTVEITVHTAIWADRSKARKTNTPATLADCQPGRTVEIHFQDPAARTHAAWIKVEMTD